MAWKVEISGLAQKNISQLDKQVANRILQFLFERLAELENARAIGEALKSEKFASLWKYRVGDYRIIAQILDHEVTILVVRIGNRKEVYRK